MDLAELLLADLRTELPRLGRQNEPVRGVESSSFAHGAGTAPTTVDGHQKVGPAS